MCERGRATVMTTSPPCASASEETALAFNRTSVITLRQASNAVLTITSSRATWKSPCVRGSVFLNNRTYYRFSAHFKTVAKYYISPNYGCLFLKYLESTRIQFVNQLLFLESTLEFLNSSTEEGLKTFYCGPNESVSPFKLNRVCVTNYYFYMP